MTKDFWCAMSIGALAAACTSPPIRPSSDRSPVSVPISANCTFNETYRQSRNCCVMKPYPARKDVDAAYAAAVRAYGFKAEPREYELDGEAYPDLFLGHRHDVQAGQSYQLKGLVVPRNDPRLGQGLWLRIDLEKVAPEVTEVAPVYCTVGGWSMENQTLWHDAVQQSIRSALPPAVD